MPRKRTYGLDIDTIAYATRVKVGSGVDILPENLKQINKFVVGVKKLGLWETMICWPLRSIHNAGKGSNVYSLGGLGIFNGTFQNTLEWNMKGIIGQNASDTLIINSFSLSSITPSVFIAYNRLNPSIGTQPNLTNSPINFGMNWFSQARTYIHGYNAANIIFSAYTFQNSFHNQPNFNSLSIEISGEGAPANQPFYVFENSKFQGDLNQYGAPSVPFNSRQNVVQNLNLTCGTQQVSFFLFINGRNANLLRNLYKQTLGVGLNLPY